ncbi:MAG TPA: acetolactate synthase large subunit [Candidatus Binataceae bacterium]|nr:acetolactate synthase large subunit [Candidatus Binataceae bacterium]
MNGAESLIQTAFAAGVRVCFANPGTTEMPLVAALDSADGIRAVLGLFEGVCTGAADGYARMTDSPAMTLLHLGPGFANGIANLHNARRARSQIVNVIGDHATWHVAADAPLTSDIISLARPVSAWIKTPLSSKTVASDTAEAVAAARKYPGRIATLIVPSDCQWDPADGPARPIASPSAPAADDASISASAQAIRKHGASSALFLGAMAMREGALITAARIAAATGCSLVCETFPSRIERGAGMPIVERLPYFPEQATAALARFKTIVLAGAKSPVAFFGYPNLPSSVVPQGCDVIELASAEHDVAGALDALAESLDASKRDPAMASAARPSRPTGPLNAATVGQTLASVMPENAIIMDEAATTGLPFFTFSQSSPRHTYLSLTGGAIGQGLPCATGAAVACPDRRVIAFQADGSGMYTVQSLWTQARESLNVTTLLCNNRSYRILQVELARAGITEPGAKARSMTSLANPEIRWADLARSMGVPAVRVDTAEALAVELERACATPGPNFIEMML